MLKRRGDGVFVYCRWREGETWRTTRQTIGLKYDAPYLGGRRTFWRCPNCGLGARKLFDVGGGEFRCRRCGRLADRSQRLKTWQRAIARASKIRRYCGSNGDLGVPFPERPRRMRRAVYEGLKAEAERLEAVPAEAWGSVPGAISLLA